MYNKKSFGPPPKRGPNPQGLKNGKEIKVPTIAKDTAKKIIKSVQNKVDKGTKVLYVKYKNKKGTEINRAVDIPIGRKKKLNG